MEELPVVRAKERTDGWGFFKPESKPTGQAKQANRLPKAWSLLNPARPPLHLALENGTRKCAHAVYVLPTPNPSGLPGMLDM
ncbi:magnesium or manganese-dependent protein phosphatase [Anopheles sinensis]|uniref:Magnesium or manganese-dependent protein phosphatase n=1 Tax=Anopheles sinensis TaxID=74873 RepID=A0A084WHP7_ANOSI|nr:magnesium or manganese-dependent protein phosphatase [Anopheles sinensis]